MARTTTDHTIVVESAKLEGLTRDSAVGSGSKIYPGHLLEKASNGSMIIHASADEISAGLVALPNKTPDTDTYDTTSLLKTPYAKGETVYFARCTKGDIVHLKLASGQNTTDGQTVLVSDGNGQVTAHSADGSIKGGTCPVALAWETISSAGTQALVKALIL